MRNLDFSSIHAMLTTLIGLVLVSVVMVGIRLVFMQTIQRRRERENRQINERLRTLIAAYKTLGASFTGNLLVDPAHLRDFRQVPSASAAAQPAAGEAEDDDEDDEESSSPVPGPNSERSRRTRDAVEAALSDIILLGTEEQVQLATQAATDMVAGHKVNLSALVVSLRDFIRKALDLAPVPASLQVPPQGPMRPGGASGGGRAGVARGGAGAQAGGAAGGGRGGGGGGAGGGMGMGVGMMGLGGGMAASQGSNPPPSHEP